MCSTEKEQSAETCHSMTNLDSGPTEGRGAKCKERATFRHVSCGSMNMKCQKSESIEICSRLVVVKD